MNNKSRSNLDKPKWVALGRLNSDEADKGNLTVVMDREDYDGDQFGHIYA